MSSALDPQGPAQPNLNTAYNQPQNAASKEPAEQATSQQSGSDEITDRRTSHDVPSTHDSDAQASALGRGDSGPLKEKSIPESDAQNYSSGDSNLDGEQMRAPGEGEVADAVMRKKQGGKGEPGFTEDLESKKQAHLEALEERGETMEDREKEDWTGKRDDVDLKDALGGRGVGVVLTKDGL